MDMPLRDFLAQREAAIREQQKALKVELREIQIARAALDSPSGVAPADAPRVTMGMFGQPTIKSMALLVLEDATRGLTSSEILFNINIRFGRDIDRTSMSPQLSRLKDGGEIVLEGDRWFTKANYEAYRLNEMVGDPTPPNPPSSFDDDLDGDVPF